MMPQTLFPGCKRGIFGLSSWEPQRKPGSRQQAHVKGPSRVNGSASNSQPRRQEPDTDIRRVEHKKVRESSGNPTKNVREVLAKYSYTANPHSPLGDEITMKQGDKLILVSDVNDVWWLVQDARGQTGYAPASYLMVLETKPQGLPWLQNREEETQEPMSTSFGRPTSYQATAKPYQSAYNREQDDKRYYCEICDKTLNGPKPYNAHMNSKAHREEVEYARSTGRC